MGMLTKIFEPIAENVEVSLDMIQVIVFDTNGTLIHKSDEKNATTFFPDTATVQLLNNLLNHKEQLGLEEIVIISGTPEYAKAGLLGAGLKNLASHPIEYRSEFYDRMTREGKNVLAVDDEFMLAMSAQAYINPKASRVREYLKSEDYQNAWNFH